MRLRYFAILAALVAVATFLVWPKPQPAYARGISAPPATGLDFAAAVATVSAIQDAADRRDGGALWDLLDAAGRKAMSRPDYVALVDACPAAFEVGETVEVSVAIPPTFVDVTSWGSSLGGHPGLFAWHLVAQDGRWAHASNLAAVSSRHTVAAMVAVLREQRQCGSAA